MDEAAVTAVLVVISAVDGTEVTAVDGTGEAVTGEHMATPTEHMATPTEHMATPTEHMATPLRLMGMGILITDRGTIPATGTMVITVEGAIMDTGGRSGQARSLIHILEGRISRSEHDADKLRLTKRLVLRQSN
jgi:hypothetical protein